jgi:hypothetical protein
MGAPVLMMEGGPWGNAAGPWGNAASSQAAGALEGRVCFSPECWAG